MATNLNGSLILKKLNKLVLFLRIGQTASPKLSVPQLIH